MRVRGTIERCTVGSVVMFTISRRRSVASKERVSGEREGEMGAGRMRERETE